MRWLACVVFVAAWGAACGGKRSAPSADAGTAAVPEKPDAAARPASIALEGRPAGDASPAMVRVSSQRCALYSDGTLWCWGKPRMVAHTLDTSAAAPQGTPVGVSAVLKRAYRIDLGAKVMAFDLGHSFGVAVLEGGDVAVWTWAEEQMQPVA